MQNLGRSPCYRTRLSCSIASIGAAPGAPISQGYTYSGHPVSAAVDLELIRLSPEGGILANRQKVGRQLEAGLARLASHPLVGDTRARGMLGAVETVRSKATKAAIDPALRS